MPSPDFPRRRFLKLATASGAVAAVGTAGSTSIASAAGAGPVSPLRNLPLATPGQRVAGLGDVQQHLVRFGYLKRGTFVTDLLDGATSNALRAYQKFRRMPQSGAFDAATRSAVSATRCGLPDLTNGVAFLVTCRWSRWSLTWAWDVGTADTTGEIAAVARAFATWSAAIPLTFTQVATTQSPDIVVGWRPADCEDTDMTGGTIAHADYPIGCGFYDNDLPRPVHFNDDLAFRTSSVAGTYDIETVALHEIGHIVGALHSSVGGAVMWPSIGGGQITRALSNDDLNAANVLYPHERSWRWCTKCQGYLWRDPGPCAAGGNHAQSPDYRYVTAQNLPATTDWEADWRWCSRCQGLFWGPGASSSRCPAGGPHSTVNSPNYSLYLGAQAGAGQERGWRWCRRCQGLHWPSSVGVCPAGGPHDATDPTIYSMLIPAGNWG